MRIQRSLLQYGVVAAAVVLLLTALATEACPPHPDLAADIAAGLRPAPYYLENIDGLHARGISTGMSMRQSAGGSAKLVEGRAPGLTGTFKALAVLVKFSDKPSGVNGVYFDSLLFDSIGTTVRDFYNEISYGQLDLITVNLPSSLGWRTAPQTYAWYVNGQNATGPYPQNSQRLTEDLVDQIDPLVDFSQYDNDGDGYVDVLIVIHAGSGAEMTGSPNDIWSHKWGIFPRLKDGVYISDYTIQPELWISAGDMTIGVYAHELGHAFGLPDLYDTDGSSSTGIGTWGIMGYGSWNGPGGMGGSPSHPCAWSRVQMGFAAATNVTQNVDGQAIAAVETSGEIYRLWTAGSASSEYFLIENRRKTGYDSYLRGEGLLIWHIDDAKATLNNLDNSQEWWPGLPAAQHLRVALEQADGLWEIEKGLDYGDGNDVFPGGLGRRVFDAISTPSSDSYLSGGSFVKLDNISNSGAVMTADLIVGLAAGVDPDDPSVLPAAIELAQNYPNPFNPATSIGFELNQAARISLEIYNIAGQRVRTLLDAWVEAGLTTLTWDGRDHANEPVASGVYLYRVTADSGANQVRKMVLLK